MGKLDQSLLLARGNRIPHVLRGFPLAAFKNDKDVNIRQRLHTLLNVMPGMDKFRHSQFGITDQPHAARLQLGLHVPC